jgi:hypothetical protein
MDVAYYLRNHLRLTSFDTLIEDGMESWDDGEAGDFSFMVASSEGSRHAFDEDKDYSVPNSSCASGWS